jgi:hypothetical protein
VHIIYQTVLFEEGGIQYRGDIYQYDKEGGWLKYGQERWSWLKNDNQASIDKIIMSINN